MHFSVAIGADGDQILALIVTKLAAQLDMMHLEVLRSSAVLASPAIARKYLATELLISSRFQPQARSLFP